MTTANGEPAVLTREQKTRDLFGRAHETRGLLDTIKKADPEKLLPSRLKAIKGIQEHPFDFHAAQDLVTSNIHHQRALEAKVAATVGLGHKDETVDEVLSPLCSSLTGWQDILNRACWDFHSIAQGYIEVRRDGDTIVGLNWIPGKDVYLVIEDEKYNCHYVSQSAEGVVVFAVFGDLEDFKSPERQKNIAVGEVTRANDLDEVSELIPIVRGTGLSRFYGMLDHLSAVPNIELVQCHVQFAYDFFVNGGTPDYLIAFLKEKIAPDDWAKFKTSLQENVGLGNRRKGVIANFAGQNLEMEVHKLALEAAADPEGFTKTQQQLAIDIVSAHGVPPILAGIQTPGKLGATNEFPNALQAFQSLVIGQAQMVFAVTLANTLGNPKKNGGLPLKRENFIRVVEDVEEEPPAPTGAKPPKKEPVEKEDEPAPEKKPAAPKKKGKKRIEHFNTILDEIDLGTADTVSRMRTPLAQAKAEGRDLSEGLKD